MGSRSAPCLGARSVLNRHARLIIRYLVLQGTRNPKLEQVGVCAHPQFPFLTCSPHGLHTRPDVRLVQLHSCETLPSTLPEDAKIEVSTLHAADVMLWVVILGLVIFQLAAP